MLYQRILDLYGSVGFYGIDSTDNQQAVQECAEIEAQLKAQGVFPEAFATVTGVVNTYAGEQGHRDTWVTQDPRPYRWNAVYYRLAFKEDMQNG
jgi:hypothetical protein